MSGREHWSIAMAERHDVGDLLAMIRGLAQYEKLEHLVVTDARACHHEHVSGWPLVDLRGAYFVLTRI